MHGCNLPICNFSNAIYVNGNAAIACQYIKQHLRSPLAFAKQSEGLRLTVLELYEQPNEFAQVTTRVPSLEPNLVLSLGHALVNLFFTFPFYFSFFLFPCLALNLPSAEVLYPHPNPSFFHHLGFNINTSSLYVFLFQQYLWILSFHFPLPSPSTHLPMFYSNIHISFSSSSEAWHHRLWNSNCCK